MEIIIIICTILICYELSTIASALRRLDRSLNDRPTKIEITNFQSNARAILEWIEKKKEKNNVG